MISATEYFLKVGGISSGAAGFWLDEFPDTPPPSPRFDDLQIEVPLADGAVDLTQAAGLTFEPRELSYKLRGVFSSVSESVAAEAALRAAFAGSHAVTVSDTLTGRSFASCTCTSFVSSFNETLNECVVDLTFKTPNSYDTGGEL